MIDNLEHWYERWQSAREWSEIPGHTRRMLADRLRQEASAHERTSQVARSRGLPATSELEQMFAHVYRLAATRLFDPSLEEEKEARSCRDDDDAPRTDESARPKPD